MIVFSAQLNPTVGDIQGNLKKVLSALKRARSKKADIVLFSELVLSGYPPEDLLLDPTFVPFIEKILKEIAPHTEDLFVALGLPRKNPTKKEKPFLNSAAIFIDGKLEGFQDKMLLPTYDVFDERRFFEPGKEGKIWTYKGKKIGVTICEDLWQHARGVSDTDYWVDPVLLLRDLHPDLVLNLSASPYYFQKQEKRIKVFQKAAHFLKVPLVVCNQVGANDQLVFDGFSLAIQENGELVSFATSFKEEDFLVDLKKKKPLSYKEESLLHLYQALVLGIQDYFQKLGIKKAILGLSGGIDSAVVAVLATAALGAKNVKAYFLPSRFSSKESASGAKELAKNLQIDLEEIEIDSLYQSYLDLLKGHFKKHKQDVTEENIQSRIRGNLLMALSNKFHALLLNTGNKSEFSMGYTTLYGDMSGGLAVLLDVFKTRVFELAHFINQDLEIIPKRIISKAPSAELRENQKDEDSLPPYSILDPILEDYLESLISPKEISRKRDYPLKMIEEIVHRIHYFEYKRRQSPIGIRVTKKSFTKGRIVPIVQKWK